MPIGNVDQETLRERTRAFTLAFNNNDLELVMSYFAPDATYDQFNDETASGSKEIRSAFLPQFEGTFGRMEFREGLL